MLLSPVYRVISHLSKVLSRSSSWLLMEATEVTLQHIAHLCVLSLNQIWKCGYIKQLTRSECKRRVHIFLNDSFCL